MNHTLKGFLLSIIIHLSILVPFVYAFDTIKENKKEDIKKVVLDLNMIEDITRVKQVVKKEEPTQLKKAVKKEVNKEVPKKVVQKEKKIKTDPVKTKIPSKNTVPKNIKKEIVKKQEKIIPEEVVKPVDTKPKKMVEKTIEKKESKKNELQKIKSSKNYRQTYMKNNLSYIIRAIKKYKKYPYNAKKRGIEGKCILSCLYTKKGVVENIKVKKSSGFEILDSNSIEILKLASREFKVPKQTIELHIPFNYYLN
jgi:periplasmic protein TonB